MVCEEYNCEEIKDKFKIAIELHDLEIVDEKSDKSARSGAEATTEK